MIFKIHHSPLISAATITTECVMLFGKAASSFIVPGMKKL